MTVAITIWRIIISVGFFVGGMYLLEVDNRVQKLERKQTEEALSYGSMLTKDDFLELPPVDFVQLLEAYVESARSKEANKEE